MSPRLDIDQLKDDYDVINGGIKHLPEAEGCSDDCTLKVCPNFRSAQNYYKTAEETMALAKRAHHHISQIRDENARLKADGMSTNKKITERALELEGKNKKKQDKIHDLEEENKKKDVKVRELQEKLKKKDDRIHELQEENKEQEVTIREKSVTIKQGVQAWQKQQTQYGIPPVSPVGSTISESY